MSARQPTFEIVRTDAGHHARFRAANGQIVWTTEVYTRRRAAMRAIDGLVQFGADTFYDGPEIREVDERGGRS